MVACVVFRLSCLVFVAFAGLLLVILISLDILVSLWVC